MLYEWRWKNSSVIFSCAYEQAIEFAMPSLLYSVQLFKKDSAR